MKIEIIKTTVLTIKRKETDELYAIDAKLIEDGKILPGDKFVSMENKTQDFIVKAVAIGSYNFSSNVFSFEIEKPLLDLKSFEGKIFIRQEN